MCMSRLALLKSSGFTKDRTVFRCCVFCNWIFPSDSRAKKAFYQYCLDIPKFSTIVPTDRVPSLSTPSFPHCNATIGSSSPKMRPSRRIIVLRSSSSSSASKWVVARVGPMSAHGHRILGTTREAPACVQGNGIGSVHGGRPLETRRERSQYPRQQGSKYTRA